MSARALITATVAVALFGCSKPAPPTSSEAEPASSDVKAATRKSPESRHMYRFDYTLTTTDVGKPPTSSAYTVNVEETAVGEIRLGRNVALQPSVPTPSAAASAVASAGRNLGVARMDLGLMLRCSFTVSGDDLVLRTDLELTSADQPPTVQKTSLKGDALVSPGKPSIVASSEDPATHQRQQLSVTATKLR